MVKRGRRRVEEFISLLPPLEELGSLSFAIAAAAVPDPEKEWAGSSAYSTLDKRIIGLERLEEVLAAAEGALHEQIRAEFAGLRGVFGSLWEGDEGAAAERLLELGEAAEARGQYPRALRFFETARRACLACEDKRPQIRALRRAARVYRSQGRLEEALHHYTLSARLALDARDRAGEVIAQTGRGIVLAFQGRWAQAEEAYRAGLARVAEAAGGGELRLEAAQLSVNLGMVATRQGRFEEADTWFDEALRTLATLDAPADLAVCHHNRGALRREQGRLDESRDEFRRALELPIPQALRAALLSDLAETLLAQGQLSEAAQRGREAEQAALAAQSPYYLGHMYRVLGNVARTAGDGDGLTFYEKALEIARAHSLPHLEGETLIDYASLRLLLGDPEEARAYLEHAEQIFAGFGATQEIKRIRQMRAAIEGPTLEPTAG